MSKGQTKKTRETAGNKRKLTRAEKKQIAAVIRQAKGDGKAHTAQQTIPYLAMYPDGICKVAQRKYSKSIAFEDINYQLAQADDKTAIFENWCDFLNYFDASVNVQLSFINQGSQQEQAARAIHIPPQNDDFNSIRTEYSDMLKAQLAKGNNGLVKHKYITFSIEADNPAAARARLSRIAYAVELTGTEQEKIKGNLYELDYLQHFREVIEKSIPADNYTLIYEHGELTKPAGQYFDGNTDPQLGKFIRFEAQPNDPEALKSILREQQKKRTPHTQGDFQLHIAALHDRRIEAEARRIVENVKGLGEPDSPEKTHCAVELSPYFVPLATDKDMERLLSMLPYKSLSFSTLEDRHGVYALIDKSERNKEMKKSRPSVRAQLQTEKSPKLPKKTAKSKHHELEV